MEIKKTVYLLGLIALLPALSMGRSSDKELYKSGKLPLIHLQTDEKVGHKHYQKAHMSFLWPKNKRTVSAKQLLNSNRNYPIKIKVRGHSSKYFPKKQYNIKIYNRLNPEKKAKIKWPGLPAAAEWVLHGPYVDRTLMRNKLGHWMGKQMEGDQSYSLVASHTQFVEVFLNQKYWGVYLLVEKIDRKMKNVKVRKAKYSRYWNTSDFEFILEAKGKRKGGDEVISSKRKSHFELTYPSLKKIRKLGKERELKKLMIDIVNQFEEKLASEDLKTLSLKQLNQIIHVQSFVDFILLHEMCKNLDAYRQSLYFQRRRDGRIYLGPLWDFNYALGALSWYDMDSPEKWSLSHTGWLVDGFRELFWFRALMANPNFRNHLIKSYWYYRSPGKVFSRNVLLSKVRKIERQIGPSAIRNFSKWKVLNRMTPIHLPPGRPIPNTHKEAVDQLAQWISHRIDWMDRAVMEDWAQGDF